MTSKYVKDRIRASMMGGALGDGFGAPVEINTLATILMKHGDQGVVEALDYDPGDYLKYAPCEQTGKGVITDDTCMAMATLAGLLASKTAGCEPTTHCIHQAYLRWGRKQAWAAGDYSKMIDPDVPFPEWFEAFCFSSGAGKGTLAALNSGVIGTIENPIEVPIGDGKMAPSEGAGGMMRIAAVSWSGAAGLLSDVLDEKACLSDTFKYGMEVAAITHGGTYASVGSGALCILICALLYGMTWREAYSMMRVFVREHLGDDHPMTAMIEMVEVAAEQESSRLLIEPDGLDDVIFPDGTTRVWTRKDAFERFQSVTSAYTEGQFAGATKKDLFTANVILFQSLLICSLAQTWPGIPAERMRWARTLAVTQDGDSDTLGAIVGNILGAQLGLEAVSRDWIKFRPQSADALEAAIEDLLAD